MYSYPPALLACAALLLCYSYYPPMLLPVVPVVAHIRAVGLDRAANHGPIAVEGRTPQYRGHRRGLTDRQAKG